MEISDSDNDNNEETDNRKSKKAKHCDHSIRHGEWKLSDKRALGTLSDKQKCAICSKTISQYRKYMSCLNCNQAYCCYGCKITFTTK